PSLCIFTNMAWHTWGKPRHTHEEKFLDVSLYEYNNGDLDEGRRYTFETCKSKSGGEFTKTPMEFESRFDSSANGTSYRSGNEDTVSWTWFTITN
ncbi:hypothetical protein PENTCL1PPCAC_20937, partial [Pristionchus entomophagus]